MTVLLDLYKLHVIYQLRYSVLTCIDSNEQQKKRRGSATKQVGSSGDLC